MKKFLLSLALVASALLTGCATPTGMPFANEKDKIDLSDKSIFLISVDQKNEYRKGYQPSLTVLFTEKVGATEAKDRINFIVDEAKERHQKGLILNVNKRNKINKFLVKM